MATRTPLYQDLDRLAGFIITAPTPFRTLYLGIMVIGALLGVSTLLPYVIDGHPREIAADFTFFWAAGKTWAAGGSPYSAMFQQIFVESGAITHHDAPPPYYYPPNSIALVLALGYFDLKTASALWAVINFATFGMSAYLFAALFTENNAHAHHPLAQKSLRFGVKAALYITICGAFWKASAVVFLHNTPAYLFYAGCLACLWGARTKRNIPIVIGMFFCLMKPQLGAPLLVAGLLAPQTRAAALVALVLGGIAGLIGAGPNLLGVVASLLDSLAHYGQYPENAAANVSGAGHLLYRLFGLTPSAFVMLGISLALIAGIAYCAAAAAKTRAEWPMSLMALGLVTTLFLTPSHNNYYLALAPVMLLIPATHIGKILIAAAALMTMFAWDLSGYLESINIGYLQANTALIDSIALLILFAVSISSFINTQMDRRFTPVKMAADQYA